jgi:hypothetical protein
MAKKGLLAVILAVLAAGAVSAQVTVSGGLALSYVTAGELTSPVGIGGNIYLDYLLPINIPLSLGVEVGADTISENGYSLTGIPILARLAYHFDIHPKIDLYAVAKAGYVIFTSGGESISGFGVAADAGLCYYFTSLLGLFAEAGLDMYKPADAEGAFIRFLTLGLSLKI